MFARLAIMLLLAGLPLPAAAGADELPVDAPVPTPKPPPPAAATWLARVSAGTPGTFPAPRSFAATYGVRWGGLEAAHVETHCAAPPDGHEIQLSVKVTTTGLARSLYTLDATHLSVANRSTLHPIRLEQSEVASGRRAMAHVDFTADEAVRSNPLPPKKTRADSKPEDPSKSKPRHYNYPGLYDMNTALLYVRSLPMHTGDERTVALMTANSPYLATIKVLGRGKVHVGAGEYPAIECSVALEKINKSGALEPRKGFKSAHAWLSDDADRLLVKVEAQVFIGSVTLELDKVSFGGPAR